MVRAKGDLWVFGYGSLIWKPGFPYLEQHHGRLVGFHRALCIFSVRYRGTSERPGLVFGLQAGGFCEGRVYRVAAEQAAATTDYLRDREQVTGVYRAEHRLVEFSRAGDGACAGGEVRALCFVANPHHPQYAGELPLAKQARIVRASEAVEGSNADYVLNTAGHLAKLGIRDLSLTRIAALLGKRLGQPALCRCYPWQDVRPLPPQRALLSGYQRNLAL